MALASRLPPEQSLYSAQGKQTRSAAKFRQGISENGTTLCASDDAVLRHFDLVLQEQSPGLIVVADEMELDFVSDRRGKPSTANDSDLASIKVKFGNVLG